MSRVWFYVVDNGTDWELRDHQGDLREEGRRFADQEDALRAAIQLARAEWRHNCEPSGVRLQSVSGPWQDVTTFGERGGNDAAG